MIGFAGLILVLGLRVEREVAEVEWREGIVRQK